MIFIAGGTLAFFFELLLLSKKSKSVSDWILAFWMFFIGLHLFFYYFNISDIEFRHPFLIGISSPLPFIHGPMLFLYTGSLTSYFTKWKPKYFLHFSPLILLYIYYFDFFVSSKEGRIEFVNNLIRNPDIVQKIYFPLVLISGFSYIFLTYLLFRRHHRNILNNLSNSNQNNNLHWLRNVMSGMLVIWLVVLFSHFVSDSFPQDTFIYISVSIFVVFIGFFGLKQGNIFVNHQNCSLIEGLTEDSQHRYSKSGLKEERADEIKKQLEDLMKEKRLFLNENISLPQLADIINIHPNYLSQVINERFQKNFYDFINSYRVEEFKQIVSMSKNKNKTFYALALDCGFNSKASFNNSFKKLTGTTPSDFVKSL